MMSSVHIEGLDFSYDNQTLFNGLCFSAEAGTMNTVSGQNGSGKTTLFKILCTLLEPRRGEIRIGEVCLREKPEEIRRRVSAAFVNTRGLMPYLTVEQNLRLFGTLHSMDTASVDRALVKLEPLIGDKLDLLPSALSVGMRQAVQISKALLRPADVFLLDEPFLALDPERIQRLAAIFSSYIQAGKTILIATQHEIGEVLEPRGRLNL
jgi:ABC-type multidrug transport system ATPase subunit